MTRWRPDRMAFVHLEVWKNFDNVATDAELEQAVGDVTK